MDELGDLDSARRWLTEHDQTVPASAAASEAASAGEWRTLIEARAALQDVVRGDRPASALAPYVADVAYRANVTDEGVTWRLDAPEGRAAAAKAVLAWDVLRVASPGRLRPCANDECSLFLIDHSKPNTARWCSMAVCGNRMKARRHYQRNRDASV
jgi:predicted RNA-binding Zn ribbon-like protein